MLHHKVFFAFFFLMSMQLSALAADDPAPTEVIQLPDSNITCTILYKTYHESVFPQQLLCKAESKIALLLADMSGYYGPRLATT